MTRFAKASKQYKDIWHKIYPSSVLFFLSYCGVWTCYTDILLLQLFDAVNVNLCNYTGQTMTNQWLIIL